MDRARHGPVRGWLAMSLGVLAIVALLVACTGGGTATTPSPAGSTPAIGELPTAQPTARFALQPPTDWTGDMVALDELPTEALETLGLIASDGPFRYDQDGGTFGNREGVLPDRPTGFYREYTVETPGSPDRGAKRLVVGDGRDVYYTDDHYESFRFVVP